jgi:hypothetical protein
MDTIVQFGDRSLDLQSLQELQDDGKSIILLFGAEHEPPILTLTGADAQLLRDWIDRYVKSQPNGLDFMVPKPRKQPDSALVQQLRSIALNAEHPSDVLGYLAGQVPDEETFIDYLLATFGDDSIMWLIADRWWHGSYPGTNADSIIRVALKETAHFWKPGK